MRFSMGAAPSTRFSTSTLGFAGLRFATRSGFIVDEEDDEDGDDDDLEAPLRGVAPCPCALDCGPPCMAPIVLHHSMGVPPSALFRIPQ